MACAKRLGDASTVKLHSNGWNIDPDISESTSPADTPVLAPCLPRPWGVGSCQLQRLADGVNG